MSQRPKLYIIHGWTYTVEPWEKTIARLNQLGIEVEMLHVPGLTQTSDQVWTIDQYVDWANRHIPDGAITLGHSNGGRILLNLLTRYPGKLQHLILLDAAGIYEPSKKRDFSRQIAKALGPLKKVKPLRKVVHKVLRASDYSHAPENMKQTLANMLDSDKNLDISAITTPTTIIWGDTDTVTPLRQGQKMHQRLKNSTLITRAGWNHAPYILHPDELAELIAEVYQKSTQNPTGASHERFAVKGGLDTTKKAEGAR